MDKYVEWLSGTRYDRESEKYGMFKVLEFVGEKGKTKVPYFKIRFKNTINVKEVSLTHIKSGKVIDTELKARDTVKKNKAENKAKKSKKDYVIKNLHNPKNILSLDLATRSTGWAVRLENGEYHYGYIFKEKNEDNFTHDLVIRVSVMMYEIEKLVEKYNIDSVVVEAIPDFILSKGKNRPIPRIILKALTHVRGTVLVYMYRHGCQYISVAPISWQRWIKKGRFTDLSTKERTLKALLVDYKIDFKKEFCGKNQLEVKKAVWEDVADAYGLLKYVLKNRID